MEIMDKMGNMDIRGSMRSFTTHDLNKQVGEVTDAAATAPVMITRHREPRFVMMSYEQDQRIKETTDPRRAYGAGETPPKATTMSVDLPAGAVIEYPYLWRWRRERGESEGRKQRPVCEARSGTQDVMRSELRPTNRIRGPAGDSA
jgi:PHD/YefM family antitoxin component YafN of YafNO toxin-antitoxin module